MIAPPAALVLGVALVGWAWFGASDAEAPHTDDATVTAVTAVAAVAVQALALPLPEPAPAPVPRPRPAAAPGELTRLLAAPEADLRATLHAALAAQSRGGRLYARALAHRCADLAGLQSVAPVDANDPRHQRAVARLAALAAGCSQFAPAEWQALVNISADQMTADDPLLAVQQSDLDDAALLHAVFDRPDALLLDELGARLLLRRIDGEPTLYFDGQRFDAELDRATALAALRLLPCHFGLACDERDPEVWLACLRGAGCAGSRAEQAPAAAGALAGRLADALRGRELDRFLPPS
ncbi:MAG: hypothetical protein HY020_21325 [Burkholderiales bacterium]|nr:hypothetical protein [Burkholderiales bacterium]